MNLFLRNYSSHFAAGQFPSAAPRRPKKIDSVAAKTSPVQKPGKRHRKQEADEHTHPGEKPHLLLMRGQFRLSPADVSVWHDFSFIHDATAHLPSGVHPMKILNRNTQKNNVEISAEVWSAKTKVFSFLAVTR